MWEFISQFWDQGVDIATLLVATLGVLVAGGLLRRRNRDLKKLIYIEQERDDFRKKYVQAQVRLDKIDPERFIDKAQDLYEQGEFTKVEELSLAFTEAQQEAFGKAAEYLTEQRLLDSGDQPEFAEDAVRFSRIGRAAFPESTRLEELADLSARRAEGVKRGEPIEALNFDGLTDVELNRLSIALGKDGKYGLAEIAARRSVPLALLRTGRNSGNFAGAISQHADTLHKLGALDQAEDLYRQALEIGKATIGEGHPDYAGHLNNLALVVQAQGRYSEAEELYRQTLEIEKATIDAGHPSYATRLDNLAGVVQAQGQYPEAEDLCRQALEIGKATLWEVHPVYARHLGNLGHVVQAQGRYPEAEDLYRQALEIDKATIGEGHPSYAIRLGNLGELLGQQGQVAEGREMLAQALAIFRATLPPEHPDIAAYQSHLDALNAKAATTPT